MEVVVPMPDVREFEEIVCETCKRPFMLERDKDDPNKLRFVGCRCETREFYIPDATGCLGVGDGPMFLVRRRKP